MTDNPDTQLQPGPEETPAPQNITEDRCAALRSAVDGIDRVRFRVRQDTSDNKLMLLMFVSMIVMGGGLLISINDSKAAQIVIASVMLIAIAAAVCVSVYYSVRSRKVYYCYYARDVRGVFCMSVIDDTATVFAYGTVYRIEDDRFIVLDSKNFEEFFDGECPGLYSIANARSEDMEYSESEDVYTVFCRGGGSHTVIMANGVIDRIYSEQPYETERIDAKTGKRAVKMKIFEKSEPTSDFEWTLPEFVTRAFSDNGVPLPDMSGL